MNSHEAAKPPTPVRSSVQARVTEPSERNEQPDFSQGRRERRPVQTHDDAARGSEMDSAARFGQASQRPNESIRKSVQAVVLCASKESRPGTQSDPSRCKTKSAMQSPWQAAAGAEYHDCSCRGAERPAEWFAYKNTRVIAVATVLPNPSLKRSANGRPPGPRSRYGVHFLLRGPGVLPSSPA